jgi:putative endonuclease
MAFYVYVLQSLKDGRLYTGVTANVNRRLAEHNGGKTSSLRARRPLKLAYSEEYATRGEALARERYFKTPEGGVLKKQLVSQAEGPG